jgi:hypothetical protein
MYVEKVFMDSSERIKLCQDVLKNIDQNSVTIKEACKKIIKEKKLSCSVKTLTNSVSAYKDIKIAKEEDTENNIEDKDTIDLLRRENSKLLKQIRQRRCKEREIIDAVHSAIVTLPEIKAPKIIISKKAKKPEIAFLDISDVHMGQKITSGESAGLSVYDADIFKQEVNTLRDGCIEIIDIQRRGGIQVDNLIINMLGDLVDGETIFRTQAFSIDRTVIYQFFELGDYLLNNLIVPLASYFKTVKIPMVLGNHARPGQKGDNPLTTNYDLILGLMWQRQLKNNPRVEFFVSESKFLLYKPFDDNGQAHLLCHGDEIRAHQSIPFYGMVKYYSKMISLLEIFVDYLHCAHHHTNISMDVNAGELLMNGSFSGGSNLSINAMQSCSRPFQRFFGANKDHQTWSYKMYLRPKDKYVSDSWIKTPLLKF